MARVKLAVVGAGLIGRAHIERIRRSKSCELSCIADPSRAAKELASQMGVPFYAELSELLGAAQSDGAILATPNALHVEGALQCLAAKVPVLVEKPVADSLDEARKLVTAAERSGIPVLVGHHRRYSRILEQARCVIESGALGKLVAVTGSATFVKPDSYFAAGPWRSEKQGGGPILINLIHEIDNLRALVGEIVEVQALASNATRGFAVEDTVAINLRFANGALGTFMLCDCAASPRSWEQTSGEDKSYDHFDDRDCYVIAGTQGSLEIPTMRLLRYEGECSWTEPLTRVSLAREEADPLDRQIEHFCAVIRGEASPRVSAKDATRTLEATLAVAQAAMTGKSVLLLH